MTADYPLPNIRNYNSLFEEYEQVIRDFSGDLTQVQVEQDSLKDKYSVLLKENNDLRLSLAKFLQNDHIEVEQKFSEKDFIENLQQQIKSLSEEKEYVAKLWQSASETVDSLEEQLKINQEKNICIEEFVPKLEITKLKNKYEKTIESLKEEFKNKKREDFILFDKKISSYGCADRNALEIINNLEEEILKLQKRLKELADSKQQLEVVNSENRIRIEKLTAQNREYMEKMEEALGVVEAALVEKDASIMRELQNKEIYEKSSMELIQLITDTENKFTKELQEVKQTHDELMHKSETQLQLIREELDKKQSEVEHYSQECNDLKKDISKLETKRTLTDESDISKLIVLEKNLENTFHKLLVSEKSNVQITSERDSIRNDLDQMSRYYERDVQTREVEKIAMKSEIRKIQIELEETRNNYQRSEDLVRKLTTNLEEKDKKFKEDIENIKRYSEKLYSDKLDEVNLNHKNLVKEFETQVNDQVENNQKWRTEAISITEKFEKRFSELRVEIERIRQKNKQLLEKLKGANNQISEYKKLLELITKDINKISTISLYSNVK